MSSRGGIGLAAVVIAGVGALGCGGPLDTRPPRPRPDAGVAHGSGGQPFVDPGMGGSPGFDAAPDVSWPSIPGCISGQPPSPQFSADHIDPITVSCASSTVALLTVADGASQGMVIYPQLDPPIDGVTLNYSRAVCAYATYPIQLNVSQSAFRPGPSVSTSLTLTVLGPPPQRSWSFPMTINPVAIDFSLDPAVIDFGIVSVGQVVQLPVSVVNAFDGAPFQYVYASPTTQGPFYLNPSPGPGGPLVIPGETRPMFQAILRTQTTGTFDATFLVSPFQPGIPIDPACGVIRTLTMHAQVILGPPPVP